MRVSNLKIGQILTESGDITQEELNAALQKQKGTTKRLGEILLEDSIISERQIAKALAKQFSIPYLDLETKKIDDSMAAIVPEQVATSNMIVPVSVANKILTVAVSDPLDYKAINAVGTYTKMRIATVIAEKSKIRDKQRDLYSTQRAYDDAKEYISAQQSKNTVAADAESADNEDQPIIRFVNNLIDDAVQMRASDIHIEPLEKKMIVRFRVDGKLIKYIETSPDLIPSITSRIKFIGGMNIAEKRIPQDGRINYRSGTTDVDMRISSLPSVFGEKIVMRITTALGIVLKKDQIGFLPENLEKFDNFLRSNRGIILLTGATGSGKSTTLYTALKEVMRDDINIITVENPVEMIIPGITQVETNDKAGLTFASALRSILRQDPDIIMIGEIRDKETAEIAASAAITGHLVLSTMHTYNAASSVARLVDMGVPPFMVTSALLGVVAQRLVRRLCPDCKEPYYASKEELELLKLDPNEKQVLYRSRGCPKCNRIGYKGRIAVHEVMPISPKIREIVNKGATTEEINKMGLAEGMIPLIDNLRRVVKEGTTSIDVMLDTLSDGDI